MKRFLLFTFYFLLFTFPIQAEIASDRDAFGGWTGIQGEKTGYFHTQKIGDRWWLITPSGNGFFSLGMYCVRFSGIPETGTGRRAYKENSLKRYGSEEVWSVRALKRLNRWGFNTVGDWSSNSIFSNKKLPYVISLGIDRKGRNVIPEGRYGFFPDVFAPSFKEEVEKTIEEKIRWHSDILNDPWLIGYFLADEPAWYGSKQRYLALVDDFIALDADVDGKKAWVEFIKGQYKEIAQLNKVWGERYKNFAQLLEIKKIKDNAAAKKDKAEFLYIIAREFARVPAEVLYEYDSNHLILGSRPSRQYLEVMKGLGEYTDVFGISYYNLNKGYRIDSDFDDKVNALSNQAGRPLMLGVLISAKDTGLPFGMVRTQQDRGISYKNYLKKAASNPNVVGLHWFQYFDPPLKCYDKKAANWGLVNDKDDEYAEAVEIIAEANAEIYDYALGKNIESEIFLDSKTVSEKLGETPVILNSGFEQGKKVWSFQTWKGKSRAMIDKKTMHSGKKSAKIAGGNAEGWGSIGVVVQYSPGIRLMEGVRYKFSAWLKLSDVETGAFIRIKTENGNYYNTESVFGSSDWQLVELTFIPDGTEDIEYINIELVGRGIVWVDDISLEIQ